MEEKLMQTEAASEDVSVKKKRFSGKGKKRLLPLAAAALACATVSGISFGP